MQDRDAINRNIKKILAGEKTEKSLDFAYLLKMRSTLHIMCDILEDIAFYHENENFSKRNFEIENLEINLKCFVEVLTDMINRINSKNDDEVQIP